MDEGMFRRLIRNAIEAFPIIEEIKERIRQQVIGLCQEGHGR